jgi:hypothetical protein
VPLPPLTLALAQSSSADAIVEVHSPRGSKGLLSSHRIAARNSPRGEANTSNNSNSNSNSNSSNNNNNISNSSNNIGNSSTSSSSSIPVNVNAGESAYEDALCELRSGRLPREPEELCVLLRGTLAHKTRRAVERVLACHVVAARLGWDALEKQAARAYARLYFHAAFSGEGCCFIESVVGCFDFVSVCAELLDGACQALLVLQFEQGLVSLERVKRAAVEGQLRGVASRRALDLGVRGLHLAAASNVHVTDECVVLADGTQVDC